MCVCFAQNMQKIMRGEKKECELPLSLLFVCESWIKNILKSNLYYTLKYIIIKTMMLHHAYTTSYKFYPLHLSLNINLISCVDIKIKC